MKQLMILSIFLFSMTSYAQDSSESFSSDLRERTHALNWDVTSVVTKADNDVTDDTSEYSAVEMQIGYLRNFGRFEIGGSYSATINKNEDSGYKSTTSTLSVSGHFNFIENRPGNDLIPYLGLALGTLVMEETSSLDARGSFASIGVGLKWFPVSEIFALTAQLGFSSGSIDNKDPKFKMDMRQSALGIGWAFYF